jgi:hypothetical protein
MARIRSLKPEFGHHDKLSALPAEVHLFAALLLCQADDDGYFTANHKLLHAAVCPLRELSMSVHDILTELSNIDFVEFVIGTDGRRYGHIVNFNKHQKINRPSTSRIKPLVKHVETLTEDSVSTHGPDLGSRILDLGSKAVEGLKVETNQNKSSKGGDFVESAPPENLHALNYATKILEQLGLPHVQDNLKVVSAAIEAEVRSGKSKVSAFEFVLAGSLDAKEQGCEINRFFFADAKYKSENRRSGYGQQLKAERIEEQLLTARKGVLERIKTGKNLGRTGSPG